MKSVAWGYAKWHIGVTMADEPKSLRRQLRAAIPDVVDLVEELVAGRRAEARREEAGMEAAGGVGEAER